MENVDLEIEYVSTSDLVPYANNAKIHTMKQVEEIANSIKEFGNCDPIAVWTNDEGQMEIVEGHGRLLALNKIGVDECPIIRLDHLTDEQRRAYTHVHNQTTLSSGFDMSILEDELNNLDFDFAKYGFENVEKQAQQDYEIEDEMKEDVNADLKITQFIDETSQYVVLKFNTNQNWLMAQSILGIESVKGHSTKRGGGGAAMFTGVGRVVDGMEAFRKIAANASALGDIND